MTESSAQRPDEVIGERVKAARNSRGWSQTRLAERLDELGFTQWHQSKVAKLERGKLKRLPLDDALALAAALDVQLVHLLAPDEGDVQLAPTVRLSAHDFRLWARGIRPLFDARQFFTNPLIPESDWRSNLSDLWDAEAPPLVPFRGDEPKEGDRG